MSERTNTDDETSLQADDLILLAQDLEDALDNQDFSEVADLFEQDAAAAWFSVGPSRTYEILSLVARYLSEDRPTTRVARAILNRNSQDRHDSSAALFTRNFEDPREGFFFALLRMRDYRLNGRATEALEQSKALDAQLGQLQPLFDIHKGWALHVTVHIGVTAMLAGHFTRALTYFTRAQMQAPVPKYSFLTRDALVKSALIHACFGNSATANSLLKRAIQIPRTSSWIETHIDAQRNFTEALISNHDYDGTLQKLEAMSLDDIDEMWPFYILAVHRILEARGHQDEIEHRMERFDSMPLPKIDGEGFSGSIIPLKRAMVAMKAGRVTEAQAFLDRADQRLAYTQLFQAAAHIYAGRAQEAIQDATRLRSKIRGFRLMEVRRLSILAAAQYQTDEIPDCIETLKRAAGLPRGLTPLEVHLFSPETRELAAARVPNWPEDDGGPSAFLTGLPKVESTLTNREVEIIRHLAQELTRAELAEAMFISVNTLKTHLKSIYRKLGVSSAADAVLGAQRRGLI